MKSRITLNDKKRTHFKFFPMKEVEITDPESFYNHLNSDCSERHYIRSDKHKGYKITVWTVDNYAILSLCLVNEFKTQNCSLWVLNREYNTLSDLISCAKFLSDNYSNLISGFKNEMLENEKLLEEVKNKHLDADISA